MLIARNQQFYTRSVVMMRIDRMVEGGLYSIKATTMLVEGVHETPESEMPVLKGWRHKSLETSYPPIIYMGWKMEKWMYQYLQTFKIHYVLWKGTIYVMDNQFAKHVVPITSDYC